MDSFVGGVFDPPQFTVRFRALASKRVWLKIALKAVHRFNVVFMTSAQAAWKVEKSTPMVSVYINLHLRKHRNLQAHRDYGEDIPSRLDLQASEVTSVLTWADPHASEGLKAEWSREWVTIAPIPR